jgi:Zn finger protein HypA/HybF involved in hydrogenase expression
MSWKEKYKEHLTNNGSMKPSLPPELKTEIFIARAREVHGNTYQYLNTTYTTSQDKVTIQCSEHGEFQQLPANHLKGQGCGFCRNKKISNSKKSNTVDFIRKAKEVHGERYDYSLAEYSTGHSKLTIICTTHGIFKQSASNHLRGQGCPGCKADALSSYKLSNTEEFIVKSIHTHNNTYDYSLVGYTNNLSKVKIICKEHGIFEQSPHKHLSGSGCPKCAGHNHSTIYLIEYVGAGERIGTKVGITNNFDRRFKELACASPYDLEVVQCWEVDNPREVEAKVLSKFSKVPNEKLGAGFEGSTEILAEPTEEIVQFIEGLVYASQ